MASPALQCAPVQQPKPRLFDSPGKKRALFSLILGLLTLIAYNPAAHNDFLTYDDPGYVADNAHVHAGLTWDTIKWAFTSTEYSNWHPITWLSHALDCQLFHARPAGHHYMSVLLHAVCAILLFLFLEAVTGLAWRSATVAALFALHPLNVESVAWISERKSVLCMFFILLTLIAYRWYARGPSLKRYGLVALLFVFSLMSKPMSVTLPFALLLLDYWPLQRPQFTTWRKLILEKLPLLLLSGASAVVTVIVQKAGGAMHTHYSLSNRISNAVVSYVRYIEKGFWPARLACFYPHPENAFPRWEVAGCLLLLLACTAATLALRKRPYLIVGWLWFLGTMVPMIGLVQVGEQGMADRYTYLPFLGLFIALVWGICDWAKDKRIPTLYLGLLSSVVILALSAATYRQIGYWKNSPTIWRHAIAVTDRNFVAYGNLGAELIDEGKLPEAEAQFRTALALHPDDPFSLLDLGVSEKRQGHTKAAVQHYLGALQIATDPSLRATAYGNLAAIFRTQRNYDLARQDYQAALNLLPNNRYALIGLGLIAQKTGDPAAAVDYYGRAVKSDPSDSDYLLLAQALEASGRHQEAQAALKQAEQLSSNWDATQRAVNRLLQE